MADFGGMVLTTRGLNLLAKAQTGTELVINRVAAGAGVWADGVDPEAVTALVDERLTVPIQSMAVTGDGTVKITVVISNSGLSAGFIFRELGVYAQDPDLGEILYAVAYSGDRYDYLPAAATVVEKILDIYVVVGGAQNVTATISPGAVIALKDDIDEHAEADPAHPSSKIGFDNAVALLAGQPTRAQSAIEALANEVTDIEDGLAAHEVADPAHPAVKISFDNTAALLAGDPTRVQGALEALATGIAGVEDDLAAHEAADPAHPAGKISFDNTAAKLPGDPARVQAAIEALNAALIAAPHATLDYPTVCTADNRAGVTGQAATAGGLVDLPAGVTLVLGEDLGGGVGRMRSFTSGAWQSADLDVNSTYYLRGQVSDGALLIYTAKGTDSDSIPAGLKGVADATEGGGFDSTQLDILLAQVVTGAAGTAPTVTNLANAARLDVGAVYAVTSVVSPNANGSYFNYTFSWLWGRAPRVKPIVTWMYVNVDTNTDWDWWITVGSYSRNGVAGQAVRDFMNNTSQHLHIHASA